MDLALYITELLQQQEKLSIPGLGIFSQVRKDGSYHEKNNLFLPPHYETHFQEQFSDDDTLARYISSKKNISVASATYFVEKFANNIKLQSATAEVQLSQLGWMQLQNNKLSFRPNAAANTYEQEYFGLPALSVNKIWEQLSGAQNIPQTVEALPAVTMDATPEVPAPTPELAMFPEVLTLHKEAPVTAKPAKTAKVQQPAAEEITEEYTEPKTGFNPWVLVLVIITVAAIILLALYQYKPALFSRKGTPSAEINDNAKAVVPVEAPVETTAAATVKPDTVAPVKDSTAVAAAIPAIQPVTKQPTVKDSAMADVSAQTDQPAAPADAASKYQIMAGAFGNLKMAKQQIANYRKQGLVAWVFENRPGRWVKLTQGTFTTYAAAATKLHELQTANKAIKGAYVLRPKKTN